VVSQSERSVPQIKLVIADVDGTLVTRDKALTPHAIDAVRKLHEAEIRFVITSGRPPKGVKMIVDALQLSEPIAGFNGGVLTTPDFKTIAVRLIPPDVARLALEFLIKRELAVFLYTDTEWFVQDENAPHVTNEQKTVQFAPCVVKEFGSLLERAVKIVGVSDDVDAVARCAKAVQELSAGQVSAALSQPYYLDITHPDANKGHVVQLCCKHYNLRPESIATIGDMPNDILMFEKSGISIAMGNASPEVQRAATFVTASNEEDGFAKAMEGFVLGTRAVAATRARV